MDKKLAIVIISFSLLYSLSSFSEEYWMKTSDIGLSHNVLLMQSNEYGFCGYAINNSGNEDLLFMKIQNGREVLSAQLYGGNKSDAGKFIVPSSDGYYFLIGATWSYGEGNSDIWVLKIDEIGNIIWQKSYGSTGDEGDIWFASGTTDGGALIAMPYKATSPWGTVVIKIDKDGNIVLQKSYSCGNYSFSTITEDLQGGFIIGMTGNDYSSKILKVAENGDPGWQKVYRTNEQMWIWDIKNDGEGYIIACRIQDSDVKHGTALFKMDSSGNILWRKYYTNNFSYSGLPVVNKTADDGYILISSVKVSSDNSNWDPWIMRLDSHGNVVWEKQFGGSKSDNIFDVKETLDNKYIAVGNLPAEGIPLAFWLLMLNGSGSIGVSCPFENNIQSTIGEFAISVSDSQSITVENLGYISQDTVAVSENITISMTSLCSDCPKIVVGPSILPDGKSGEIYSQQLIAQGGKEPYEFYVSKGTIPEGLSLSKNGMIEGIPDAAGQYSFSITATDATFCRGEKEYLLNVAVNPPGINSVKKSPSPFRLIVQGSNIQSDVKVYIGNDEIPWPDISYRNATRIILKKGNRLKSKFPKGVSVDIMLVNGDGGTATFVYTR